jgi:hypothetical protein
MSGASSRGMAASAPTSDLPPADPRRVMMPRRKTTRADNRAKYLASERARNHTVRQARRETWEAAYFGAAATSDSEDEEPPPF